MKILIIGGTGTISSAITIVLKDGIRWMTLYLFLVNRVSLETLYIPTAKTSVLSIVPSGFSSYLCSVIFE
jgi:hypothetical protein